MIQMSCFGEYDKYRRWCRRFCWSHSKCEKETERRRESFREPEYRQPTQREKADRLVSKMEAALSRQRPEPHIQREDLENARLPCYGKYDDQFACGFCECKTECFQRTYPSSRDPTSTDSAAVGTETTRVEGGSSMNSKDFETRKAKAQKLEVVSVGNDFMVKSSTRRGGYMVTEKEGGGYGCACMDYATHRGDPEWRCKHIIAVETYLEKRGPTNGDSRYDIIDIG